jgi:hypothetical protein
MQAVPYFASVVQHILLGDFIVGDRNYPLWPVSFTYFSLGFSPVSVVNVIAEGMGLAIFTAMLVLKKDLRRMFFELNKANILSIIVLIPLVGFIVSAYTYPFFIDYVVDNNLVRASSLIGSIDSITSNQLFPVMIAMHAVLAGILTISLVQGLRAKKTKTAHRNMVG